VDHGLLYINLALLGAISFIGEQRVVRLCLNG